MPWRSRSPVANKTLIIAAMSARGYAQAAVACGYEVITLDAFADADTCSVAKQVFKLKFNEDSLDLTEFKHLFSMLDFSNCAGFLYGSLFDNTPDVLAWVADSMPLIGNPPEIMHVTKQFEFFALLDDLHIKHPEVSRTKQLGLIKQLGGTGGTHIQFCLNNSSGLSSKLQHGHYYQQKIEGVPVSLLFVADGKSAQTVGFNLQLLAPTATMPYRYGGAVSQYPLPNSTRQVFESAAQKLTQSLSLHGCNSLDAIFDGQNLWVLELNPRLSASFHLYSNLMVAHLQGCVGNFPKLPIYNSAIAHSVLYAEKEIVISADFAWPVDAMDIPSAIAGQSNVKIAQDMPVCTISAEAETAESAHIFALKQANKLRQRLY